MCVYYDSILADVDIPFIIRIYDHVWDNILAELSYCIGSKYKFGNLFLNSGHGCASTLPENIFGHFVGTIAKFLAGIFTGQDTMILSPITCYEATAITSFLYSASLLLSLVHPRVKQ